MHMGCGDLHFNLQKNRLVFYRLIFYMRFVGSSYGRKKLIKCLYYFKNKLLLLYKNIVLQLGLIYHIYLPVVA